MTYHTPTVPQTPDLLAADDRDDTPAPVARPDLKAPPQNPPVDEDAVRKGQDVLGRVKAY